jgi:uncharacterized metal-binding protein YceD (DUF177 family)
MVPAPTFSLPLADLDYGDREIDEPIPVAWLATAFADTDATPRGEPGRLEVSVSKSGRDVMVRGQATATVVMPCARTLDPVPIDLRADVFLMLAPGSSDVDAPRGRRRRPGRGGADAGAERPGRGGTAASPAEPARRSKPASGGKGAARSGRPKPDDGEELAEEGVARDTYDGDRIVLDAFVREFLLLELPMFPLREDLRREATPAIDSPPIGPAPVGPEKEDAVDPRLAPLAALRSRLRDKKE